MNTNQESGQIPITYWIYSVIYVGVCVCVCMYVCMYVFVGLMLHPHAVGEGCGTRLPGEGGVGVEVPQEVVHSGTAQQSLQRLASSQGNTQ